MLGQGDNAICNVNGQLGLPLILLPQGCTLQFRLFHHSYKCETMSIGESLNDYLVVLVLEHYGSELSRLASGNWKLSSTRSFVLILSDW